MEFNVKQVENGYLIIIVGKSQHAGRAWIAPDQGTLHRIITGILAPPTKTAAAEQSTEERGAATN